MSTSSPLSGAATSDETAFAATLGLTAMRAATVDPGDERKAGAGASVGGAAADLGASPAAIGCGGESGLDSDAAFAALNAIGAMAGARGGSG